MKYVCLVYLEEPKLRAVDDSECMACGQGFQKAGLLVAAEALEPVQTARTVRVRGGKTMVTDGPFAETKEQLLGFYVLDCPSLEEAIEAAKDLAREKPHGTLEIRPIAVFNAVGPSK